MTIRSKPGFFLTLAAIILCAASLPVQAQQTAEPPGEDSEKDPAITSVPEVATETASSPDTAGRATIEEIVVSARKRVERLEETPVAVTALSENTLREAGITRIDEIQDLVPNLQIHGADSGAEANFVIRGVGKLSCLRRQR